MNNAIASVAPTPSSGFIEANKPVVFVDGVPEPCLSVKRLSMSFTTSEHTAELVVDPLVGSEAELVGGQAIVIATPHLLVDGESRWHCLLEGQVSDHSSDIASRNESRVVKVRDRFSARLSDDHNITPASGASSDLAVVLNHIAALLNAELVLACELPADGIHVELLTSGPLTYSALLTPILEQHHLRLISTLKFEPGAARRTLSLVDANDGSRVCLPWPDSMGRGGFVRSFETNSERLASRAWVAFGDRPVVEDTFGLHHGWDPALQGEPDSEYGRSTSTEFGLYGPVYRAWVLNEDGAHNDAPYNLGGAFDVGEYFDSPGSINGPLRFDACLTLDSSGRRIEPVIESSTDSGASWTAYPGQAEPMADRSGVLLTDDELPASILSAAKAGTLRLRVTASLQSPDNIQARRWRGNPFAGPAPTREIRFGDRYIWRHVAPTSIHADQLATGELAADTRDDRLDMRQALQQLIEQTPGPDRKATVELDGAWTSIKPGDHLAAVQGKNLRIDGTPVRFNGKDARVIKVCIDFGVGTRSPRTYLELE